jgi:hypothetical protein
MYRLLLNYLMITIRNNVCLGASFPPPRLATTDAVRQIQNWIHRPSFISQNTSHARETAQVAAPIFNSIRLRLPIPPQLRK